jgi:hypothetical protein
MFLLPPVLLLRLDCLSRHCCCGLTALAAALLLPPLLFKPLHLLTSFPYSTKNATDAGSTQHEARKGSTSAPPAVTMIESFKLCKT